MEYKDLISSESDELTIDPVDLNQSIFEISQESYQDLFDKFEKHMRFKNYTIEEWLVILELRNLREDFSLMDLEKYTIKISGLTDTIVTNYSLSSSNYHGLKKSVERATMLSKATILNEIEMRNGKKVSSDQLETLAYEKVAKIQLDLAVAEMFYHFWKIQYDKIFLLNQRVTSLNILKNIESKGINLT